MALPLQTVEKGDWFNDRLFLNREHAHREEPVSPFFNPLFDRFGLTPQVRIISTDSFVGWDGNPPMTYQNGRTVDVRAGKASEGSNIRAHSLANRAPWCHGERI